MSKKNLGGSYNVMDMSCFVKQSFEENLQADTVPFKETHCYNNNYSIGRLLVSILS